MTCAPEIGSFVVGAGLGLKTGRLAADIPKKKNTTDDSLGFQKNDDPSHEFGRFFKECENGFFQISSFASLIALGSWGWFLRVSGTVLGVWCCLFGLLLGCLGSLLAGVGLLLAALGFLLGGTWSSWVSLGASCGSLQGSLGHLVVASGWTWLVLAASGCFWTGFGPRLAASGCLVVT